jgi:hypothetical protein
MGNVPITLSRFSTKSNPVLPVADGDLVTLRRDMPARPFQDSNLRYLSATAPPRAQFPPEPLVLSTHAQRAASMTTIVLVGVAGFLVVLAIVVKARGRKPKNPEKWEKAQIVKQLLALSEREDLVKGIPGQQSVSHRPSPHRRAAAANTSSSRTVRPA